MCLLFCYAVRHIVFVEVGLKLIYRPVATSGHHLSLAEVNQLLEKNSDSELLNVLYMFRRFSSASRA